MIIQTTLGQLAAEQSVMSDRLIADLDAYGPGQPVTATKRVTGFGTYLLGYERTDLAWHPDYAEVRAALRQHGGHYAIDVYGREYVAAAMIPED